MSRIKIVTLGWAGASVFFAAVLEVSDLGHKPLGFALYSNAVHFGLWALVLPFLIRCVRRFPLKGPKRTQHVGIRLILVAVLGTVVALAHWAVIFPTYFPYRASFPTFQVVLRSELFRFLPYDVLVGIVMITAIEAWLVFQELQQERMRAMDLERQLAVSRLEALRTQLRPHFLFNTLHTIAGLTIEDPPTARRMVIALGDVLRSTLKDTGERMRPLAEELEFSDLYLGIEKLRFCDRLVLNYDIEPSAARALVPQFLLQPLFENSIRHGASRMIGACEIRFSARRERNSLHIDIHNDGPKRDPSLGPPRFGVGLSNTTKRLRIHYGERHTFQYSDLPEGGVQIKITIPYADAGDSIGTSGSVTKSLVPEDCSVLNDRMAVPTTGRT